MNHCSGQDGTDCAEVLEQLFSYLDSEETTLDPAVIRRHLVDCAPCMTEHDREAALKALLKRSCACEPAPETLRIRIVQSITRIRIAEA